MTRAIKTVHLYCPTNKRSAENVVISPFHTIEQVLQGVRLAISSKYAALYTIEAKPIVSVEALEDEQRVLVAVTPEEVMLPDAQPGFVLYNGEEGDDVDPDVEGFGEAWEDLTDHEKCEHISSLNIMKPTTRMKLRITRPYQSVADDIAGVEQTAESELMLSTATMEAESNIENCWGTTYDHFLPAAHCPPRFKTNGCVWSLPVLAALNVLSSFTHGQAGLAADLLEEAIKMRIDEGENTDMLVKLEDVMNTINVMYERAGVVSAKLTKKGGKKGTGKQRRKAARGKGKKATSMTP